MKCLAIGAALLGSLWSSAHAAEQMPSPPSMDLSSAYIGVVDTERGTRLDNLLHCILFRVDLGTFPTEWRDVCAKLMSEAPK